MENKNLDANATHILKTNTNQNIMNKKIRINEFVPKKQLKQKCTTNSKHIKTQVVVSAPFYTIFNIFSPRQCLQLDFKIVYDLIGPQGEDISSFMTKDVTYMTKLQKTTNPHFPRFVKHNGSNTTYVGIGKHSSPINKLRNLNLELATNLFRQLILVLHSLHSREISHGNINGNTVWVRKVNPGGHWNYIDNKGEVISCVKNLGYQIVLLDYRLCATYKNLNNKKSCVNDTFVVTKQLKIKDTKLQWYTSNGPLNIPQSFGDDIRNAFDIFIQRSPAKLSKLLQTIEKRALTLDHTDASRFMLYDTSVLVNAFSFINEKTQCATGKTTKISI